MPRRLCLVLALALLAALTAQASATAPGRAGRIAYVSEPQLAGAFVESVLPSGGRPKRLSAKLPHGSFGLSFAPDGKRIALTIQKPDGRHVQILSGGQAARLARGRAPAWSPDGRWIAFLSGQKVGSAIFLVHPDGTGLHAIGPRHVALGASTPAWSPDGRTLVYTRETKGRTALWAIGADGSRMRTLVTSRVRDAAVVLARRPARRVHRLRRQGPHGHLDRRRRRPRSARRCGSCPGARRSSTTRSTRRTAARIAFVLQGSLARGSR